MGKFQKSQDLQYANNPCNPHMNLPEPLKPNLLNLHDIVNPYLLKQINPVETNLLNISLT